MTRLVRLLPIAVCLVAACPAGAAAAPASFPAVSKVSPLQLGVGDVLTVRGKGFRSGKGRNTVVFKREGGRAVFAKAGKATRTTISVTIPPKLLGALGQKSGKPVPTRFRVRVLAGRFGKRYTSVRASPTIGPGSDGGPGDDVDGDRLAGALERRLGLDPLKADTDGDDVGDGFEYYSAKDLNNATLPFPGKQPYPNALDKEDAGIDHDGDGLSLRNEHRAWAYTGSRLPLSYSDGNQLTGGGATIDAYRDVDGDGATNYSEVAGPLSGPAYWTAWVKDNDLGCAKEYVESTYPGPKYKGLSFVDPDTDGDGRFDGADDIDHDGLTNAEEGQDRRADWCEVYVSVGPGPAHDGGPRADRYARHDPFNPCKPVYSAACHKFVPLGYYVKTDAYIEDWAGAEPNR